VIGMPVQPSVWEGNEARRIRQVRTLTWRFLVPTLLVAVEYPSKLGEAKSQGSSPGGQPPGGSERDGGLSSERDAP